MEDDTPKGRLLHFLTSRPPPPTPPPSNREYLCFRYEGFAVCSGPLFNTILLSLLQHDPELHTVLIEMLGAPYVE